MAALQQSQKESKAARFAFLQQHIEDVIRTAKQDHVQKETQRLLELDQRHAHEMRLHAEVMDHTPRVLQKKVTDYDRKFRSYMAREQQLLVQPNACHKAEQEELLHELMHLRHHLDTEVAKLLSKKELLSQQPRQKKQQKK